jgi:hypothetical protein
MLRQNRVAMGWVALGLGCLAWLGLYDYTWNDYDLEASASVHQLVGGHFVAFLEQAPTYGGSLLLRAPFAFFPGLWGGGQLAVYRLLALPCLVAAGALAVWLTAHLRTRGDSRLARGTALGLLAGSPAMLYALEIGHPEEILAGVLVVGAVITAGAGRCAWAAVLLGLAVGTKSWALVAVAPVLCALPWQRGRTLLLAGAIAAAVLAPFELAQHLGRAGGGVAVSGTGVIFQPQQLWWFLGDAHAVVRNTHGQVMVGYRAAPGWLGPLTHPLIVLSSPALALLWWRRRRGRAWEPLALLTLVLMLRCLLDPWNIYYYAVPCLIALTVWETLHRRDAPALALGATAATWAVFEKLPAYAAPDLRAAAYLTVMLPAVSALSLWLFAPGAWSRLTAALTRREARRDMAAVASP